MKIQCHAELLCLCNVSIRRETIKSTSQPCSSNRVADSASVYDTHNKNSQKNEDAKKLSNKNKKYYKEVKYKTIGMCNTRKSTKAIDNVPLNVINSQWRSNLIWF